MVQQTINLGTVPNDGTGDPLRTAMDKVNDNFTELYSRETAAFYAAAYGASAISLNNTPAIRAAVAAAHAAGGGTVVLPAGTLIVNTAGDGFYALAFTNISNVRIVGAGEHLTVLKVGNAQNVGPLAFTNCSKIAVSDLTLDGNYTNNTTLGTHGLRAQDFTASEIRNVRIINTNGYGMGFQGGTIADLVIEDFHIEETLSDGIDIKNRALNNRNIRIQNGCIKAHGRAADDQVAIDIRGPAVVSNITVDCTYARSFGIRQRQTADIEESLSNGPGGRDSTVSNCVVHCNNVTGTVGFQVDDPWCVLSNCTVIGAANVGVWVTGSNASISNVTVDDDGSTGGTCVLVSGDNNLLVNVRTIGGDVGIRCVGTNNSFVNCTARDAVTYQFRIVTGGNNYFFRCEAIGTGPYSSSGVTNYVFASPTLLKPNITGSRESSDALTNLLMALADANIITNSTTNIITQRNYEAETLSLLARFSLQPTQDHADLINDTIAQLKSAGLWSKLDVFYILAGENTQSALLNWKSSSYNLTANGTLTFTPYRGYAGDGSTGYLNSAFNPTTAVSPLFAQLSCHLGLYSRTASAGETFEIGNDQNAINTRSGSSFIRVRLMRASTNGATPSSDGSGHFCASRSISASFDHYRNGGGAANVAGVAQAQTSFDMWLCGANLSVPQYSTKQIACGHWGSYLTPTEVASMSSIIASHLARIGAAV